MKTINEIQELPTDKNDRPIMIGDILKVFHFIGSRNKKYFMYKQVMGIKNLGKPVSAPFYRVSHLNMKDAMAEEGDSGYWIQVKAEKLADIEIVQSATGDFEERRKVFYENN